MLKRSLQLLSCVAILAFSAVHAADSLTVGVVNLKQCVEKSKLGQQEKSRLESLKKQMTESLEKTEKELTDLAKKLEDEDHLDSLSPAAEEELKGRFQQLNEEFVHTQNQYLQLLNQANYRMLQTIHDSVAAASEEVLKERDLNFILSKDAVYAMKKSLDITQEVIERMDRTYEKNQKNPEPAPSAPPAAPPTPAAPAAPSAPAAKPAAPVAPAKPANSKPAK